MNPPLWPLPPFDEPRTELMLSIGVFGGDVESSFLRLRFSGVASSGAESTSRSDSGELGRPLQFGELVTGKQNELFFVRGLLDGDSDPVSWSVSFEIRCRFEPCRKWKEFHFIIHILLIPTATTLYLINLIADIIAISYWKSYGDGMKIKMSQRIHLCSL